VADPEESVSVKSQLNHNRGQRLRARRESRVPSRLFNRITGTLMSGVLALAIALPAPAAEILVDGVAAQVGNQVVLASEIEEIARPILERMRDAGLGEDEMVQMRKDALERLIESRLIEGVVQQLELGATKPEIDAAIASIAQDTGLTLGQLAESVAGYGMSFNDYRLKIKSEIERNKVLSTMVRSKIQIQQSEIEARYNDRYSDQPIGGEEVHLRHILVASDPQNPASHSAACQQVDQARRQIASGQADFRAVAQQISSANPDTGGELGWTHLEDLAGWMAPELLTMNEMNPLSGVIDMPFGCNLLQLVERRAFQRINIEQARPELEQELYREKTDEAYVRWVNTLRERTYIERMGIYAASSVAEASAETP
jgi:peptidyl-prolyl cis-trans isomerase SurA